MTNVSTQYLSIYTTRIPDSGVLLLIILIVIIVYSISIYTIIQSMFTPMGKISNKYWKIISICGKNLFYECPNCKAHAPYEYYTKSKYKLRYCPQCGKKLEVPKSDRKCQ